MPDPNLPVLLGQERHPKRRIVRIEVDERPRCEAVGDYLGDDVPCDRHAGHRGRHEWTQPGPPFETFGWTSARRTVRREQRI